MFKMQHDAIVPADLPKYWRLLNSSDMQQYLFIRSMLMSPFGKNSRSKIENFGDIIQILKYFCIKGDTDDWKRFLVAGICFIDHESIAINTHQLTLFIGKCKSSVNGSFHKLGYIHVVDRNEAIQAITSKMPILKDNTPELRKWTYRSLVPRKSIETTESSADEIESKNSSQEMQLEARQQDTIKQDDYYDNPIYSCEGTIQSIFDECDFDLIAC